MSECVSEGGREGGGGGGGADTELKTRNPRVNVGKKKQQQSSYGGTSGYEDLRTTTRLIKRMGIPRLMDQHPGCVPGVPSGEWMFISANTLW